MYYVAASKRCGKGVVVGLIYVACINLCITEYMNKHRLRNCSVI